MHHLIKNHIVRRVLKVFFALIVLVVLLPFSLYIPWVQNVAKDYACRYASESTGLDIKLNRILLEFPLNLSIEGLSVVEECAPRGLWQEWNLCHFWT